MNYLTFKDPTAFVEWYSELMRFIREEISPKDMIKKIDDECYVALPELLPEIIKRKLNFTNPQTQINTLGT